MLEIPGLKVCEQSVHFRPDSSSCVPKEPVIPEKSLQAAECMPGNVFNIQSQMSEQDSI